MAQGLGPALLLAAGALANLEHIQTTCHALREEDCETEACVRAVRWAHQPRLGHGCKHMFFDVGANVGLHGRFLYEPGRFRRKKHGILRATPYHVIFKEIWPGWPGDNSEACVVAIEPNPAHRAWLTKQAVAYQKKGWRYVAVFAAAGAAKTRDATLTFYRQDRGANNDWGFSVKNTYGGNDTVKYEVPFVGLAGFLHHHVGHRASRGDQRVLMKMDIEGSEYVVIPQLLRTGASRLIDMMTLEVHPAFCPISFPAAGTVPAKTIEPEECAKMGTSFAGELALNGTKVVYLDDESWGNLDPRIVPLPTGSTKSKKNKKKKWYADGYDGYFRARTEAEAREQATAAGLPPDTPLTRRRRKHDDGSTLTSGSSYVTADSSVTGDSGSVASGSVDSRSVSLPPLAEGAAGARCTPCPRSH